MGTAKKIKQILRKFVLGHDIDNYFFSQSGEDAILQKIFSKKLEKKETGFYIDVGAFHPYSSSNTYLFYLNGWRGINIDAYPGSMKLFNKYRPKDINIECGVNNQSGKFTFYTFNNQPDMNSFSIEHLSQIGMENRIDKKIEIDTYPLKDILNKHLSENQEIDFINIDAEGYDYTILASNNWEKWRPKAIAVELPVKTIADIMENLSAKFLFELGYEVSGKTVILDRLSTVIFTDKHLRF